jgi:hypothetical protein
MFERDDLLTRLIRGTVAGIAVFVTVGALAASARPIVVGHHGERAVLMPHVQPITPAGVARTYG